jgi:hypothetical protein
MVLRNVAILPQHYTTSKSRRPRLESTEINNKNHSPLRSDIKGPYLFPSNGFVRDAEYLTGQVNFARDNVPPLRFP